MAIQKWYTQPQGSFASFYYLDTTSRDMIRIRLELNRIDRDGPVIVSRAKRYVGFADPSANIAFDYKMQYWAVNGSGQIVYSKGSVNVTLSDVPQNGWWVIDFSLGSKAPNVHYGNKVTGAPVLPEASPYIDINEALLETIAKKAIGGPDIPICAYNAEERDLVKTLTDLYNKAK